MVKKLSIKVVLWVLAFFGSATCASIVRNTRTSDIGRGGASFGSPLLEDDIIDLESIEGIHQLTKLVLLKTDSLPGEEDEIIDGRYLNSLMETLYTGLRKPFKSVSADILGIFPSFEEVQVNCEKSTSSGELMSGEIEKQKLPNNRRRPIRQPFGVENEKIMSAQMMDDIIYGNERTSSEVNEAAHGFKSPTQVCKAVTGDCLSMEDLVQILPPTVTAFNQALVRLCPIMLFRIMNHLCRKPSDSLYAHHDTELISSGKIHEDMESMSRMVNNNSINLNTLQILKNLQNSDELSTNKRPMKLHKKLKTQTTYKGSRNINSGSLTHQGVDEQLLKIRLKLSEPSIEKVWIFSLLFVILSIVVSMGGLIVLPFVRKTTRRRILTLFEGLAVGGLSGSATLHMFPQAFGLVDENYHRYFWRIFGVFFGIYLCYLCERTIKILRVVRTRMRRRSRGSIIEADFRYGLPSVDQREDSSTMCNRICSKQENLEFDTSNDNMDERRRKRKQMKRASERTVIERPFAECMATSRFKEKQSKDGKLKLDQLEVIREDPIKRTNKKKRVSKKDDKRLEESKPMKHDNDRASVVDSPGLENDESILATRQRLIKCLKSVQSQFSPVYAVYSHTNEATTTGEGGRMAKTARSPQFPSSEDYLCGKSAGGLRRNRLFESNSFFSKAHDGLRSSTKRQLKQKEIETMLYHRNLMEQQNRRPTNQHERGYLEQRLSSVKDVAGERQDQDNAARMSVDTVAWMIVFGDAVLNVIDGLSIGAAFERNILAGISIAVAVMLEEVTHRLGTFAVLIRAGMSMQQSLLCTFLSACALFPGLVVGILLSDATEDATPYIFCAAGGIFLYMALVDVMKEMNRSIENAIRKDIKSTLQIFALQNIGILLAVVFLSFLALYEQAMDFEEYQMQYNKAS